MNASDKSTSPLSAAWLTAGTLLFVVSLGTPLVVLNYLPDPRAKTDAQLASQTDQAQPLVGQADDAPDYPEMTLASSDDAALTDRMGSLATLIDRQGQTPKQTHAPDVRRMILEAVTVDLESSKTLDALEQLHVPIRDCEAPVQTSEGESVAARSEIEAALHALHGLPVRVPYEKIAGPVALDRTASFEGMRVEFCSDLTHISAVEILPLNVEVEPAGQLDIAQLNAVQDQRTTQPLVTGAGTAPDAPVAHMIEVEVIASESQPLARTPVTTEIAATQSAPGFAKHIPQQPQPQSTPGVHLATDSSGVSLAGGKAALVAPRGIDPLAAALGTSRPTDPATDRYEPASLLAFYGRAFEISEDAALPKANSPAAVETRTAKAPVLENTAPNLMRKASPTLIVSDETTERDLNLNRRARFQAQVRLALLGHDPKGIDGIFGDGTRSAIAALQVTEAIPPTGYLDAFTLALLNEKSERNYADWRARRVKKRAARAAAKAAPVSVAPQRIAASPRARRAPSCARDSKGIIISNQSFDCDLNVLRESLGSLFGTAG